MAVHIRQRKLGSGSTRIYLDIYHNGRRSYEFPENLIFTKDTKRETLELAGRLASRRQLELAHSDTGFTPTHQKKSNLIDLYREIMDKKSLPTRSSWVSALIHLQAFSGGRIPFSSVNHIWFEEFQAYLLDRVGQNTTNLYLKKIKSCLKEAVRNRIFASDPSDRFTFTRSTETSKVFLVAEELQKLAGLRCPNQEVKRAFLFSCYTGLRLSDIETLSWDMIKKDKSETTLHFRQKKTKGFEYLPLHPSAVELLKSSSEPKTVPFQIGKVFTLPARISIRKSLLKWVKSAKIEKHITFHCARHTYATLSISSGVEIAVVKRMLGHRDIKSTAVYAKVTDQAMTEAIKKIPNLMEG